MATHNPVSYAAALAWKPADLRPPWQWAEENYYIPVSSMPGRWRSDNSPWVKQLMEDFADNSVEQITVLCSAQSAKTETMLVLLNWIVAEDPSPTMWVTSSDEEALKFANERLMPSLRMCPPVAKQIPVDRTLAKSMEILFPTMMLEAVGANSKAKLQSRSRRFLLLDEVRNWPAWALPMVRARATTWWNSRIVILTTPEKERDTVHMQFLEGTQFHYHVPCLNPAGCDYRGPLDWANMRAEHPTERTADDRPKCVKWADLPNARGNDGVWNFDVIAPHVRYVCPRCGHLQSDHPQARRRLTHEGNWVAHNPNAPTIPRKKRSYTWNALLPTWIKWASLVQQFILAENALEFGDHEPLKAFITEKLGQPWQDRLRFAKSEGYLDARVSNFDPKAPWPNEARRFMMIDVQGKGGRHFYYSIHAFAQGGHHRVLHWGKAWSVEELRSEAVEWKVPPANVGIDSGHWASEVYGYIMESGVLSSGDYAWKAMKGDKAPHYLVEGVRQPWTWSWVDPFLGDKDKRQGTVRPLRQVLFSKLAMLDRAEAAMRGLGPTLEICEGGPVLHEYKMQLTAYERFEKPKKASGEIVVEWIQKRPDDHWSSTFRMAMVSAIATGLMDLGLDNTVCHSATHN